MGDFAAKEVDLPPSDIVILDKVICCYEDVGSLVDKSLSKAKRIYALTFPNPSRLMKYWFSLIIIVAKTLRWTFRPYWHDWDAVLMQIERAGFKPSYRNSTLSWAVHVFERIQPARS